MSDKVKARAYAKINLFLRIKGLTADRRHEIEALNRSVDLFDEITLEKSADGAVTSDFEGDNSLVVLERIRSVFSVGGMRLSVRKGIPIGGGLGGSSADAAAAALAAAKLWGLDEGAVKEIVAPLFGDVAFQMTGGTAIARGIGDRIEVLPDLPPYYVLLAFPEKGVSTKEAYALSDETPKGDGDMLALYNALSRGKRAQSHYLNDLLEAALRLNDEIGPLLSAMRDERALLTGMSGSGSTLFSLYAERADAERKAREIPRPTLVTETISPFLAK